MALSPRDDAATPDACGATAAGIRVSFTHAIFADAPFFLARQPR
jgi:hypothetical protein